MNKKTLLWTLVIEGVIGIAVTLGYYFWEKSLPCQASPCYPPLGFIFPAIFTVLVLFITLLVSGIGRIVKKYPEEKSNALMNIIVILIILAIFTYFYFETKLNL